MGCSLVFWGKVNGLSPRGDHPLERFLSSLRPTFSDPLLSNGSRATTDFQPTFHILFKRVHFHSFFPFAIALRIFHSCKNFHFSNFTQNFLLTKSFQNLKSIANFTISILCSSSYLSSQLHY